MMAWPAAKIQKTCKSAAVKIHMAMLSSIERLGEIRRYLRMRQSSPSHCIAKLHRPTPGVLIIPDREPHCCQPVNKKVGVHSTPASQSLSTLSILPWYSAIAQVARGNALKQSVDTTRHTSTPLAIENACSGDSGVATESVPKQVHACFSATPLGLTDFLNCPALSRTCLEMCCSFSVETGMIVFRARR